MNYRGIKHALRLKMEDIKTRYPDLARWLDRLDRWGKLDQVVLCLETNQENGTPEGEVHLDVFLFTEWHEYHLSIRPPLPGAKEDRQRRGYLGGSVKTRAARPGEDWQRGNDLTDGPYHESTFLKIMLDLVSWELVDLEIQETMTGITPDGKLVTVPRESVEDQAPGGDAALMRVE